MRACYLEVRAVMSLGPDFQAPVAPYTVHCVEAFADTTTALDTTVATKVTSVPLDTSPSQPFSKTEVIGR